MINVREKEERRERGKETREEGSGGGRKKLSNNTRTDLLLSDCSYRQWRGHGSREGKYSQISSPTLVCNPPIQQ